MAPWSGDDQSWRLGLNVWSWNQESGQSPDLDSLLWAMLSLSFSVYRREVTKPSFPLFHECVHERKVSLRSRKWVKPCVKKIEESRLKQLSMIRQWACYIVSEINQHEVSTTEIKVVVVLFNRQDNLFLVLLMWQFETGSVENEKPWLRQMFVGGLWAEAGGVVLGAAVGRH